MPQFFNKVVKILCASINGFIADDCAFKASSLTFYTLLSIVPILAVTLGLAKGFGFEKKLEEELYRRFTGQEEIVELVVSFANSLLKEVAASYIAGIGVLFLFLFVISLFWTIESTFNDIWKVKRARSYLRTFTDYLALMILCPFLIVMASSMNLLVISYWQKAIKQNVMIEQINTYLWLIYWIIPLLLIWMLFTSLYLIMPNTKVKLKYAIMASVVSGSLYYSALIIIIRFQIGISQYSPIYGSFAALPLFLFLLNVTWNLVLFGAEFAYYAEHLSPSLTLTSEREDVPFQSFVLLLSSLIVKAFKEGKEPWSLKKFSMVFGVSEDEILETLEPLIERGLIARMRSDNTISFQPGKDLPYVTIYAVLQACDPLRFKKISLPHRKEIPRISTIVEAFEKECGSLKTNRSLSEIFS